VRVGRGGDLVPVLVGHGGHGGFRTPSR
jgi:hypothetical protein